jgi:uncharacterized membrane protein YdjX (TVP38/TMEM64 family)
MQGKRSLVLKGIIILFVVVLVVLVEKYYGVSRLFRSEQITVWLTAAGAFAPFVFLLLMITAVVVSPIPSVPLDIVAGSFFGPVLGTLYAAVGALLGSIVSFLITRVLGRELIARLLHGHINFCQQCSDKLLTKVVFFARLLPVVSFDVISYGAGLTNMSLWKFSLATFFGTLPLTFFYVSFGSAIVANQTMALIAGAVFVLLFFLLPRWIERYDFLSLRQYFQHTTE